MNKPFSEETKDYRGIASETPYQKAQQVWDNRIGSSSSQANNWRLMAIINGVLALLLLIILVVVLRTDRDRLFVAQVTSSGRVQNVELLKEAYKPSVAQKQYFLAHFVKLIRSVPLDPVVAKKDWSAAYAFLGRVAAKQLNERWQQDSPIKLLGKKTVTVTVTNVNPISEDTFDISWREKTLNIDGQRPISKNYSGVFTLTTAQPETEAQILQNPLGIFIARFHFSVEVNKTS